MLDVRFQPLGAWQGKKTVSRKKSPFNSTFGQTLDLLEHELKQIRARDIVIQVALDRSQIRNDGWPYSSAKPQSPEVVLSFESTKGSLRIPCDIFSDYVSNLRAIALSLEALRKVDRYGITMSNEQYQGWAQLPAGADWRETLGIAPLAVPTAQIINERYRELAKKLHPDAGGSDFAMALLTEARDRGLKEIG